MHLLIIMLLTLLSTTRCDQDKEAGQPTDALYGSWIHSWEEDSADFKVYRPASFTFPPSRGRDGFEIRSDGKFVWNRIAPADGNERIEGSWSWEKEEEQLRVTFNKDALAAELYLTILEATQERLQVKIDIKYE